MNMKISNSQPTEILLEWSYEPKDFFGEPVDAAIGPNRIQITDGNISVLFNPDDFEDTDEFRERIENEVESFFTSEMLREFKPYNILGKPSVIKIHANGRQNTTVNLGFIAAAGIVLKAEAVVVHKDKDGNIIRIDDPKAKRSEEKKHLLELCLKHAPTDPVAASIIASFKRAMESPEHEFYRLYEIRDALRTHFGDDRSARNAIGISETDWSRFGEITNDPEIIEGRHPGKSLGGTRHATQDEIREARELALKLVKAYLEYLERPQPN